MVVLMALAPAGSASAAEERYHGRVVDADTSEPLPGAVVVVVWMKRPIVSMNGPSYFHDARETLTDAEGRFFIGAKPALNLNPLRTVQRHPEIIVYKPGYAPFPGSYSMLDRPRPPDLETRYETLLGRRAATVPLPQLTTARERALFVHPDLHPHVPLERVPLYVGLLNEQRARAGLEPLPGSNVQHRPAGEK
jgi:hypothetical protein